MNLIYDQTDKYGTREQRFLISRKETEDCITENHKYITDYKNGEHYESRKSFKTKKCLCVNGPKVGQKIPLDQETRKLGYVQYNCAEFNGRFDKKKDKPSSILVFIK
jgi:hypothetical protein